MHKRTLTLLFLLASFQVISQEFSIDPGHTAVTSKVQRFGMVDVLGRFNEVTGTISYNSDHTKISADITVNTSSYASNNTGGENAVKSPNFLDVAKFPEMTLKSNQVKKQGDQLVMIADLTIKGVTKEVSIPFTMLEPFKDPQKLNTIAVHASFSINRLDYGVFIDRKLPGGKELIGSQVKIEINALAVEQ